MDLHQLHEWEGQGSVRDIAEKMMAFHTDGTVIATAEVLGLDLHQLWDHFVNHTDPEVIESCADPVVLAYLTVKGFENWCMDQLAETFESDAQ